MTGVFGTPAPIMEAYSPYSRSDEVLTVILRDLGGDFVHRRQFVECGAVYGRDKVRSLGEQALRGRGQLQAFDVSSSCLINSPPSRNFSQTFAIY